MHVILCDLCMYDHEKKIVLLAQNVEEKRRRKKKLRIRKKIPLFVPDDVPPPDMAF